MTGDDTSAAAEGGEPLSRTQVAQSKQCLHTRTRCKIFRHLSIVASRDLRAYDVMSTDTCVKFVDEIMEGISDRSLNWIRCEGSRGLR